MKVKLLKKVRRRYEIHKISRLEKSAPDFLREAAEEYGYPFYTLYDSHSEYRYIAVRTLDNAKDRMIRWINSDYKKKVKGKKRIQEKVWYND